MTKTVIESVTFKLVDNMSGDRFLDCVQPTNDFLKSAPGFVRRCLSVGEDGTWIDHIEWTSLEQAMAASQRLMEFDKAQPFMAAIAPDSVITRHDRAKMLLG